MVGPGSLFRVVPSEPTSGGVITSHHLSFNAQPQSAENSHGVWGVGQKLLLKKKGLCSGKADLKVPSAFHSLTSTLLMDRRTNTLLSWFQSPVKTFCHAFWKRYRFKIIVGSIILIVGLMLFSFMYSTPVSEDHGDKDNGTGCSWAASGEREPSGCYLCPLPFLSRTIWP